MQTKKRRRLFVDNRVQGGLILRVLLYWVLCLVSVHIVRSILCGLSAILNSPLNETWILWISDLVASLLFIPLVIGDLLRVTNRFTGPMLRLRREMHRLAQGQPVAPLAFRAGDVWQEFAEAFNAVRAHVERLSGQLSIGRGMPDGQPPQVPEDATPAVGNSSRKRGQDYLSLPSLPREF